ncbi:MAG TPA: M28 family peptidase [Candidatus Limnocylindria bacterium]|nr:M28 family peptidase [Candidatus Limnocylindria bacterium]
MRPLFRAIIAACLLAGCGGLVPTAASTPAGASPTPSAAATRTIQPSPTLSPSQRVTPVPCRSDAPCNTIQDAIARIDAAKMNDHLLALVNAGSRDPRHPGHAKAVAYIKEQLGALGYYGWKIESQRTVYQGIPLENIFATLDLRPATAEVTPPAPVGNTGWILISAHYDSTANRTPGWRPAFDPAPGADDNGTGTAALLEFARVLSTYRVNSPAPARVVLAFFDGEELFFKGSAAYVSTLSRPYPYKAAINLDMVGFNPLADRLDLLWYTNASAGLRDRVLRVNDVYKTGVSPLNAQFAADGNTIMDAAPFGLAGIPSIALCQRYGEPDATFPGNFTFHTVNDTPDKLTNRRLWLKAAKLTLAAALELAEEPSQ